MTLFCQKDFEGKDITRWSRVSQEVYGLVNVAAFLAQCMQETIQYNACDETLVELKFIRIL